MRSLVDGKGESIGWRLAARDTAHSAFEIGPEINEIAIEAIIRERDVLRCPDCVGHIVEWEKISRTVVTHKRFGEERVGEWEGVSANMVKGVEPYLVFESSGVSLVVVR